MKKTRIGTARVALTLTLDCVALLEKYLELFGLLYAVSKPTTEKVKVTQPERVETLKPVIG